MPKRSRQAHIPRQQTPKRRKITPRRGEVQTGADAFLDLPIPVAVPGVTSDGPVAPIPAPVATRTRALRSAAAQTVPRPGTVRASGQLPTFERAYLVDELKRIGTLSASLLALIIVLTFVLR